MKKTILIAILALSSAFAFAVPNSCYNGTGSFRHIRCAIQISGNTFHVMNSDGYVKFRYTIVEDNNGRLTLQSDEGLPSAHAYWWTEDGQVYLKFNDGLTYVHD